MPMEILVKSQTHAHGLQPCINLSKRHKMCKPQYQKLLDPHFPRARPKDKVVVKVIVGELHSLKSQIYTRTIILHLDFKMSNNQTINQTIPKTDNRYLYVLNGTAYIGHLGHETETKAHHTLLLFEDGTSPDRIQAKDEEANFVYIATS
ncbi:hypothetical protein K457DRAFT_25788 [Linnemannia elongata AG-77]|uniref:Uncharacterized protein n=1 Tax=Linnemannia elongata AG-77 TaxID=1314771 RepID=A0A197JCB5_9FUNG|nr:hypothetical protein K457DRAFT_25788 [Linnemannia elongata AG-77]